MAMTRQQNHYRSDSCRRPVRNELYNARKPRAKKRSWACYVLVTVIFVGMFAQVFSLAQLMGQSKQIAAAKASMKQLKAEKQNLEVALNQHKNLKNVEARAEDLGMVPLSADAIRRVPVMMAANDSDTNAQTANNGGNQ